MSGSIIERLKQAVINYEMETIADIAREALKEGIDPVAAIEQGLAAGIKIVGEKFSVGELFLPELVMAAEAMKAGVAVLEGHIPKGRGVKTQGRVLLATVQGDIHEIGKNLVATMLTSNGFQVVDMGVNQKNEDILKRAMEVEADIVGVSALMTTTMPRMRDLVDLARQRGLRTGRKYIVGGAPVTEHYAKEIRSDGTAGDAAGAVELAKSLMAVKE